MTVKDIEGLLDEALSPTGQLLPSERLAEIHAALRSEIERLVVIVEAHAATADRGAREWYAMDSALAYTRDVLAEELGSGPLAGSLLVREMARRIHGLRTYAGEPS